MRPDHPPLGCFKSERNLIIAPNNRLFVSRYSLHPTEVDVLTLVKKMTTILISNPLNF